MFSPVVAQHALSRSVAIICSVSVGLMVSTGHFTPSPTITRKDDAVEHNQRLMRAQSEIRNEFPRTNSSLVLGQFLCDDVNHLQLLLSDFLPRRRSERPGEHRPSVQSSELLSGARLLYSTITDS